MTRSAAAAVTATVLGLLATSAPGTAQHAHTSRDPAHHATHMAQHGTAHGTAATTTAGQSAFATISWIVAELASDPATDWSRVDIEALRRHLIDMDEVTLNAQVAMTPVDGGATLDVTGAGRAVDAIRRMTSAHAGQPDVTADFTVVVREIADGARVTVVARRGSEAATAARIRGLGFIGILALGDHHGPHHLAMARGGELPGHRH